MVRNITSSGASTYKIKDEHGRIARDKKVKDELERILSCFNIQVSPAINFWTKHYIQNITKAELMNSQMVVLTVPNVPIWDASHQYCKKIVLFLFDSIVPLTFNM